MRRALRSASAALFTFFIISILSQRSFADWPPLSPEDLQMTSIKEQPGAPAVILDREEIDDDMNNVHSVYERIKILTDAGREQANVEIPYRRRGFGIAGISGRTVQSSISKESRLTRPYSRAAEFE